MAAIFISSPLEVDNRLHTLGWSREDLLEVVDAMVAGRYSCTENDPPSAPGWTAWRDGIRRLREIGRGFGWVNSEEGGISWLVDERRKYRFSVSNTDDATGIKHRDPQNRSKKGASTDRVIAENEAMLFEEADLPEMFSPLTEARVRDGAYQTWYLCVYADGEKVTAELSCPSSIEGGYFKSFHERIILLASDDGDLDISHQIPDNDDEEVFDIPVSKK